MIVSALSTAREVKTGGCSWLTRRLIEAPDETTYEEGCLSVPERHHSDVARPAKVTVRFLDATAQQEMAASGLLATRAAARDRDHPTGIPFIDHISAPASMILRKLLKARRRRSATRPRAPAKDKAKALARAVVTLMLLAPG